MHMLLSSTKAFSQWIYIPICLLRGCRPGLIVCLFAIHPFLSLCLLSSTHAHELKIGNKPYANKHGITIMKSVDDALAPPCATVVLSNNYCALCTFQITYKARCIHRIVMFCFDLLVL
eukprot:c24180_g1_i7 orf=290-643(+)